MVVRNPTEARSGELSPGVRQLLTEIRSALDLPPGDSRVFGRATTVTGVLKALDDIAVPSDRDAQILAALLRDSCAVTR